MTHTLFIPRNHTTGYQGEREMKEYDFNEWMMLIRELRRDGLTMQQAITKATSLLYLEN